MTKNQLKKLSVNTMEIYVCKNRVVSIFAGLEQFLKVLQK